MEFWTAVANLAKSKRVVIPALLIGLSMGAAVYFAVPMRYVSSTTMVLTTTEFGGTESLDPRVPTELTNPMLNFSDSLRTTADMLIWSMSSKDLTESLERDGVAKVVVNDGRTNPDLLSFNGPILYVTGESTDPEEAQAVVVRASDIMRDKLVQWQNSMNAPATTYITMVDVIAPTSPEPDRGARLNLATLALMGGIFLSFAAAYVSTRRARRASAGPDDSDDVADRATPGRPEARSVARQVGGVGAEPASRTETQPAPVGVGRQ